MVALVAVFTTVTNFAYSTGDAVAKAKNDLRKEIVKTIDDDISKTGNYLYENNVHKINDKVKITFKVGKNHELRILKVDSRDYNAAGYVKSILGKNKVTVSHLLEGKAFTLDIRIKFKAK